MLLLRSRSPHACEYDEKKEIIFDFTFISLHLHNRLGDTNSGYGKIMGKTGNYLYLCIIKYVCVALQCEACVCAFNWSNMKYKSLEIGQKIAQNLRNGLLQCR